MDCILLSLSTSFAVDWLLKNLFIERLIKNSFKAKGLPFILFQTCIKGNLLFRNYMLCYTTYYFECGIGSTDNPLIDIFLYSHPLSA